MEGTLAEAFLPVEKDGDDSPNRAEAWNNSKCNPESSTWVWAELHKQFLLAGPMIIVTVLQYAITVVSVMMVGHLGELELASASIATSFAGVSGYSFLTGMATALETLCGQAYGAKRYRILGIYMQKAMLLLNAACIPIVFVWLSMGPVLRFLGQDPAISSGAGLYARWLLPGLFANAFLQPLVKFLQAQSIVFPMAISSAITASVHIPLCWYLIFKLDIGFKGAAIATTVSQWLNVLLLALYVQFSPLCRKTWNGFSVESYHDFSSLLKLALPSSIMICLEWWVWEFVVLLSGFLPNPQLQMSALSVCLNTTSLLYMIPFGLSAAASTRVANEMGAGRPHAARGAMLVSLSVSLIEGLVVGSLLFSLRNLWGWAYSNEVELVSYIAVMTPYLAILVVADAVYGVLCGVTKGCGWQSFGAYTNLAAFYVIGLPIGITLAFSCNMNGQGLWMGLIAGITTEAIILSVTCLYSSWEKQAHHVAKQLYNSEFSTEG